MKHVIHGSCDDGYRNNLSCLNMCQNGQCGRGFPKSHKAVMSVGDGFSQLLKEVSCWGWKYSTKHTGGMEVLVTNKWVVACNAYLLLKFKCHINIEYCHTVVFIKCLFLHHFKGEDMVTEEGLDMADGVSYYTTRRYISSCRGNWRYAKFNIFKIEPPVIQWPIHLPGQQNCCLFTKQDICSGWFGEEWCALISFFDTMQLCENDHDLKYKISKRDTHGMLTSKCGPSVNE